MKLKWEIFKDAKKLSIIGIVIGLGMGSVTAPSLATILGYDDRQFCPFSGLANIFNPKLYFYAMVIGVTVLCFWGVAACLAKESIQTVAKYRDIVSSQNSLLAVLIHGGLCSVYLVLTSLFETLRLSPIFVMIICLTLYFKAGSLFVSTNNEWQNFKSVSSVAIIGVGVWIFTSFIYHGISAKLLFVYLLPVRIFPPFLSQLTLLVPSFLFWLGMKDETETVDD